MGPCQGLEGSEVFTFSDWPYPKPWIRPVTRLPTNANQLAIRMKRAALRIVVARKSGWSFTRTLQDGEKYVDHPFQKVALDYATPTPDLRPFAVKLMDSGL